MSASDTVAWKDEDEIGGIRYGPLWVNGQLVSTTWVSRPFAVGLAKALGVELEEA